ncbi:MAG: WG repeat-containing protein [Cytophagaceae bacterium]
MTTRIIACVLILTLAFPLIGFAQKGLLPVKQNYKWGYADISGKLVINPVYDRVGEFNICHYASFRLNNSEGLLDTAGTIVIPATYRKLVVLDSSCVKVMKDSLWALRKIQSQEVTPFIFNDIEKYYSFYKVFRNNKCGITNSNGKVLVQAKYDSVQYNPFGFFIIYQNKNAGVADSNGQLISRCRFSKVYCVTEDLLIMKDSSGWSGLNRSGTVLFRNIKSEGLPVQVGQFIEFNEKKTKTVYSVSANKIISEGRYQELVYDSSGYIFPVLNRKLGIMSNEGNVLKEPMFFRVKYDTEVGLFRVCKDGKWGMVNNQGTTIVVPLYDFIGKFNNSVALISNEEKWGIINKSGKVIHPCNAQKIIITKEKAEVYNDLERIVYQFDQKGNVTDKMEFKKIKTLLVNSREQQISDTSNRLFKTEAGNLNLAQETGWYQRGGKWGLKDENGNIKIPPMINEVVVYPEYNLTLVTMFSRSKTGMIPFYGLVDNYTRKFIYRPACLNLAIDDFRNANVARIKLPKGPALLSREGKVINQYVDRGNGKNKPMLFGAIGDFSEGKARINIGGSNENNQFRSVKGGLWGYIDRDGNFIIEPKYVSAGDFRKDRAIVSTTRGYGLINTKDEFIIKDRFSNIIYISGTRDSLLYTITNSAKSGIMNKDARIIIDPVFEDIGNFSEGLAKAKNKGRWGFIDSSGEPVVDFAYFDAKDFHEGLAAVKKGNKYGYVNKSGQLVILPEFDFAGDFHNGLAPVKVKGKFGYIDANGNLKIPFKYNKAGEFHGNYALAKTKRKYGIITSEGRWKFHPSFRKVIYLDKNYILIKKKHYGLINPEGKLILQCKYKKIESFSESLACVTKKDGKTGYVDSTGKFVVPAIYKSGTSFAEGKAVVLSEGKYGYINSRGQFIIPPTFKKASSFKEGFAYVSLEEKNGFIDSTGQLVISLPYFQTFNFSEGIAAIKTKKNYYFINTAGRRLYNAYYKEAGDFINGFAKVKSSDYYGIMDSEGQMIINYKYDYIGPYYSDYAKIKKNNFCGIYDRDGKEIVAPDFEVITYIRTLKIFRVEKGDRVGYVDLKGKVIWEALR